MPTKKTVGKKPPKPVTKTEIPDTHEAEDLDAASADNKGFRTLLAKGQKRGYVTVGEVQKALPKSRVTREQLEEHLEALNDLGIELVSKEEPKAVETSPTVKEKSIASTGTVSDMGGVTDPVKMYLREMGLVTLLTREGEVEIAKKIELGEQEVMRCLLEAQIGVDRVLHLGEQIENGLIRPKHVLRDIDEGDAYVDEAVKIEGFVKTIHAIKQLNDENLDFRKRLFLPQTSPAEKRVIRKNISRRNLKILNVLKEWRLEGSVMEGIEEDIRKEIDRFCDLNDALAARAASMGIPVTRFRDTLKSKTAFLKWSRGKKAMKVVELTRFYTETKAILEDIQQRETANWADVHALRRIISKVEEGHRRVKLAKSELTRANLRLVVSIAKKYTNRGLAISGPDPGGQYRPHESRG